MDKIILDSQYFPCVGYFSLIQKASVVAINDTELFNKQSYRNRCSILGANKTLDLIVPVDHKSTRKINGLKINHVDRWSSIHKKSIESSYRKSPFFEHYDYELLDVLQKKHELLIDLNMSILSTITDLLEIDTQITTTSKLTKEELIQFDDLTEWIHPKRAKISTKHSKYLQVFENKSIENLSIIDAIFCLGPETSVLVEETQHTSF